MGVGLQHQRNHTGKIGRGRTGSVHEGGVLALWRIDMLALRIQSIDLGGPLEGVSATRQCSRHHRGHEAIGVGV